MVHVPSSLLSVTDSRWNRGIGGWPRISQPKYSNAVKRVTGEVSPTPAAEVNNAAVVQVNDDITPWGPRETAALQTVTKRGTSN